MFVDRFVCYLRFYHLEFDKEAIADGCRSENAPRIGGGLEIKIRELSFCGLFGPCFKRVLLSRIAKIRKN